MDIHNDLFISISNQIMDIEKHGCNRKKYLMGRQFAMYSLFIDIRNY